MNRTSQLIKRGDRKWLAAFLGGVFALVAAIVGCEGDRCGAAAQSLCTLRHPSDRYDRERCVAEKRYECESGVQRRSSRPGLTLERAEKLEKLFDNSDDDESESR